MYIFCGNKIYSFYPIFKDNFYPIFKDPDRDTKTALQP